MSYNSHELLDRSCVLMNNWDDYIVNHQYLEYHPNLAKLAESIRELMFQFYQEIANIDDDTTHEINTTSLVDIVILELGIIRRSGIIKQESLEYFYKLSSLMKNTDWNNRLEELENDKVDNINIEEMQKIASNWLNSIPQIEERN